MNLSVILILCPKVSLEETSPAGKENAVVACRIDSDYNFLREDSRAAKKITLL